jgi:hypothetical protein
VSLVFLLSIFPKRISIPKSYKTFRPPADTNDTQIRELSARIPVSIGPRLCPAVFATLIIPIIAVRSRGSVIIAIKAARGAVSIDAMLCRRKRKTKDQDIVLGIGIIARKTDDGRCVKTIVWSSQFNFLVIVIQSRIVGTYPDIPNFSSYGCGK